MAKKEPKDTPEEMHFIQNAHREVQELFREINALPVSTQRVHILRKLSEVEFWLEEDLHRMNPEHSAPE